MPKNLVGYTELGWGKLKMGKGFLKPNFGALQNLKTLLVAVELDSSTARPAFWHKILTW